VYRELLERDMDQPGGRDTERDLILLVLNAIGAKMLPEGWDRPGNDVRKRRAENFFYQGSIGWWMEQLLPALRYVTMRMKEKDPLFVDDVDSKTRDAIIEVVDILCGWDIWSTEDEEDLKAMRSNTVKNVAARFPKYNEKRILTEFSKK